MKIAPVERVHVFSDQIQSICVSKNTARYINKKNVDEQPSHLQKFTLLFHFYSKYKIRNGKKKLYRD